MVLTPEEAAAHHRPGRVDGIGPAGDWQRYWQSTNEDRQKTKSWNGQ